MPSPSTSAPVSAKARREAIALLDAFPPTWDAVADRMLDRVAYELLSSPTGAELLRFMHLTAYTPGGVDYDTWIRRIHVEQRIVGAVAEAREQRARARRRRLALQEAMES